MDFETAYASVSGAVAAGRPAHGYLVVGSLRGQAMEFAFRLLEEVVGDHVRDRANPDVHWLFPEMKSRVISVAAMRERMVDPISTTAFAGGWKAGVIVGADCLNDSSANAFLKTLEEPPPRTLFLLLTEKPESLLPTIVSRCQRVDLEDARGSALDGELRSRLLDVLSSGLASTTARVAAAARLAEVLADLKEQAEEEVAAEAEAAGGEGPGEEASKDEIAAAVSSRYLERRADVLKFVESWFRDIMAVVAAGDGAPLENGAYRAAIAKAASGISVADAFRNVEAVEALARTLKRGVPEAPSLTTFFQRIAVA